MQFRYSLRRYFAFQMDNNGGNTSLNARSFINNLDNRYNYVNLTEGKRRFFSLGVKKHRIHGTKQQAYNAPFFSFSLSLPSRFRSQPFSQQLRVFLRILLPRSRDSYRFLASFQQNGGKDHIELRNSFRLPRKKKLERNKFDQERLTIYTYIYKIPRKRIAISIRLAEIRAEKSKYQEEGLEFRNTYRRGSQRRLLRVAGNWNKNETLD